MKISEIKFSVVIHEWDDFEKIKKKFYELLNGINKEKIEITENFGEGLISSKIYYISAKIKNKKDIIKFFKNLLDKNLDICKIIEEMNFDENFNIYLRFDKKKLIEENRIFPIYDNDVFHLKISIDSYKKNKELVKDFLIRFLNEIKNL